ncbi:MAG: hypothetical protein K2Y23_11355 [Cyanobacteria bacterium]|nr:hypothetical protein [Cyanobacteriota bacterium]
MKLVSVVLIAIVLSAQGDGDRTMAAVRSAMAPALPFPATSQDGAVPANGNTEALWMVRPLQPGDRSIEVIANPLNDANQLKAARAMAQIENNIQAAQRRAALQYDRAVAEAKRTGKSQEVDGVSLSDEGVAGVKIDAESHVLIDVTIDAPFTIEMASAVQPAPSKLAIIPGAVAVLAMPSNTYRDADGVERYAEAQTMVFLGQVAPPEVQKQADHLFGVSAPGSGKSLVIRLRGNEVLIADLLRKTNWNSLLELLQ